MQSMHESDLQARVLPDGSTSLVFLRGDSALRTSDNRWGCWASASISGPRTKPFDMQLQSAGRMLIVQLHATGAARSLGVPMSTLLNRYEELEAVVDSVPRALRDHVRREADDLSCIRAIESWLLNRVRSRVQPRTAVESAIHQLLRGTGDLRVGDLAQQVQLSRRHLARVMHERVGVSTKLFARIARFDRAVQLSRQRPSLAWVQIALETGFSDQAHLTREFVELGGIRPSDLRGARAEFIW